MQIVLYKNSQVQTRVGHPSLQKVYKTPFVFIKIKKYLAKLFHLTLGNKNWGYFQEYVILVYFEVQLCLRLQTMWSTLEMHVVCLEGAYEVNPRIVKKGIQKITNPNRHPMGKSSQRCCSIRKMAGLKPIHRLWYLLFIWYRDKIAVDCKCMIPTANASPCWFRLLN